MAICIISLILTYGTLNRFREENIMLIHKLLQSIHKSLWAISLIVTVLSTNIEPTVAAEKITFTYGLASQSVSLEELETFAATGAISPSIAFLLNLSKQKPEVVRWLLTQEFPSNTVIMSKLLNSLGGEYALTQSSNVVHSSASKGNIQAIRGALITSSSDDRTVSLLEVWRNYPTKQVYIDGKALVKIWQKLSGI